jgi:type IV secretion system protein VirB6
VQTYAVQTAARGATISTVDVLNMLLIAVLVFLILRQVMPIASGLAGGISLNTFNLTSRVMGSGLRGVRSAAGLVLGTAAPSVARAMSGAVRVPSQALRSAADFSGRYVHGKAGAGIAALGRSWRNMRR